jgi:hypothetical protein
MPRKEEDAFFASWDGIYREVRRRNLASGAAIEAPSDTTKLHERNVTKLLKETHAVPRRIPLAVTVSHAGVGDGATGAPEPVG